MTNNDYEALYGQALDEIENLKAKVNKLEIERDSFQEDYKWMYEEAKSELDWYKDEVDRLESELEDTLDWKQEYEDFCENLHLDVGDHAKIASVSDERKLEMLKSILRQDNSPILPLIEELENLNFFK